MPRLTPHRLRSRPPDPKGTGLEHVFRPAGSARRQIIGLAILAVVIVGGLGVFLTIRQYHSTQRTARTNLHSRAFAVAALVNTFFSGQIQALTTAAQAPAVTQLDLPSMRTYFMRLSKSGATSALNSGVGWIDRSGNVRISTTSPSSGRPLSVADRSYFRRVVQSGRPWVSEGLISRRRGQALIVIAVPTRNASGKVSGVLAGSLLLRTLRENEQTIALGYTGLKLIDRRGHDLLNGLQPVDPTLLARVRKLGHGVVSGTGGFDGHGSDVVGFAGASVPGWTVSVDQSASSVYSDARRTLLLGLASIAVAAIIIGLLAFAAVRRSRRESALQAARARAWSALSSALQSATRPTEVATALAQASASVFTATLVCVGLRTDSGLELCGIRGAVPGLHPSAELAGALAELPVDGPDPLSLESQRAIRRRLPEFARQARTFRTIHGAVMRAESGEELGTLVLAHGNDCRFRAGEWALTMSFVEQAAHALERTAVSEIEHDVAEELQRSLLPAELPAAGGVELTGRYRAGGKGVEVGGDWYDAVVRPDGIVHLSVGDVTGRGVQAATLMGGHRNTFRAYAREQTSPAEILRRMSWHLEPQEMLTAVCVTVDPWTGELTYASAGHPPQILVDTETGTYMLLDRASAPPLGVADEDAIDEASMRYPDEALLALYTDGLVERRSGDISEAITLLGGLASRNGGVNIDGLLGDVEAELGAPVDDVALLLARLGAAPASLRASFAADPALLAGFRTRLRGWLERRGYDTTAREDIVLAVSEAFNNAVEHAYFGNSSGSVDVELENAGDLRITVQDHGAWRPEQKSDERGRGVLLMRNLMRNVSVETGPGGTRVVLTYAPAHADDVVV